MVRLEDFGGRWSVRKKYRNSLFSGTDIMLMVESNNTNHFLKEQNKIFQMHLIILPKLPLIDMITGQVTQFFSSAL